MLVDVWPVESLASPSKQSARPWGSGNVISAALNNKTNLTTGREVCPFHHSGFLNSQEYKVSFTLFVPESSMCRNVKICCLVFVPKNW